MHKSLGRRAITVLQLLLDQSDINLNNLNQKISFYLSIYAVIFHASEMWRGWGGEKLKGYEGAWLSGKGILEMNIYLGRYIQIIHKFKR